jgi:O-antigen/teichoic acid export membrane protein
MGALFWLYQGNSPLAWLFLITALFYPLTSGLSIASGTLVARERFTHLFWFRILEALADLAGFLPLLLGLWWISRALTYYSTGQALLAALLVGTTWWLLQQFRAVQTPAPEQSEQDALVRYGRHQTAIGAIGVVQARTDALLVSAFFPLTVMADYSLALLLQSQLKNFWTIYLSVRYPPLVRLPAHFRKRRMLWEGALVTVGFAGTGLALALVAAVVVPWALPPSYGNLLPYLYWLIVAFVATMPGNYAETFFRTEQDEKRQYYMRGMAAVFGAVLPLALLPALGLNAVFIGRVAAALLYSLLGVVLFLKARPTENMRL